MCGWTKKKLGNSADRSSVYVAGHALGFSKSVLVAGLLNEPALIATAVIAAVLKRHTVCFLLSGLRSAGPVPPAAG